MWLATARTLIEEEALHKLMKVPGCCISNPCYQFERELSGPGRSKGNLHRSRMVNSEVLQSVHLKGYKNHIRSCKNLPWRDATSHRRRRCLTSAPHAATAIPVHQASQELPLAPRPPRAGRLASRHQNQGNRRQTARVVQLPARENTHWQGPNPCQSLCKWLNSTSDLMPLLKALCPCLVVSSHRHSPHKISPFLFSEEETLCCLNRVPVLHSHSWSNERILCCACSSQCPIVLVLYHPMLLSLCMSYCAFTVT